MSPIEEARAIVAAATNAEPASIADDASIESVAAWDSVAHVHIMLALEERAGGPMPANAVVAIMSVPAIAAYLETLGRP